MKSCFLGYNDLVAISICKWLFGVSGIGIIISCSLAVSSYASFISNPLNCEVQLITADAIAGAKGLAVLFVIPGIFALFSASILTFRSILTVKKSENRFLYSTPINDHSILFNAAKSLHALFLFCSVTTLSFALVLSYNVASQRTKDSLKGFSNKVHDECLESSR